MIPNQNHNESDAGWNQRLVPQ